MAEQKIFDVVIVGGGPAGLTASIYTSRHNLKTLVIAKSLGGQMALTNEIENWPGSELTSGFELATKFKAQTEKWQTEFNYNEVKQITKTENGFVVRTGNEEFSAKAVVLAFGLTPRNLEVTGEEKLTGRGVSYCATCDGPFFRNKLIGIVGDGNAAVESLIYLSGLGQKIYLFHKEENLRAAPALIEKAKALTNTEFVRFQSITELVGENKLEKISFVDFDGENKEIMLNGLFVEIGHIAKTGWLKDFLDLNEKGEIKVNRDCETSVTGIFAAGDCTDSRYKQIVIACGEGAKAALQANKYILNREGKVLIPDWGKSKKK